MVLFARNKFRNHRFHFVPGNQPAPKGYRDPRDYAAKHPSLPITTLDLHQPFSVPTFPFKRSHFSLTKPAIRANQQHYQLIQPCVLELPKGRVLGGDGVVITPEGELLASEGDNFSQPLRSHQVFRHDSLPNLTPISARIAVIASRHADVYFHWMCNVLPRLELLRQTEAQYDCLYLGALTHPFQFETLRTLGVDLNQILIAGRSVYIEAEQLIVPSLPAMPCDYPPSVADYLRRTFLPTNLPKPTRRLYLSRRGAPTRQILNEPELVQLLEKHGFERVMPEFMTVAEQASLFASAEAIVSPHGAALTNLAFCSPGTRLIEIFHPDHICDCYWQMTHHLQIDHHAIMAKRAYRNLAKRLNDRNHDCIVDLSKLKLTIT